VGRRGQGPLGSRARPSADRRHGGLPGVDASGAKFVFLEGATRGAPKSDLYLKAKAISDIAALISSGHRSWRSSRRRRLFACASVAPGDAGRRYLALPRWLCHILEVPGLTASGRKILIQPWVRGMLKRATTKGRPSSCRLPHHPSGNGFGRAARVSPVACPREYRGISPRALGGSSHSEESQPPTKDVDQMAAIHAYTRTSRA